jgi:hypothetical protein
MLGKTDPFGEELCQFVKGIVIFIIQCYYKLSLIIYVIDIDVKIFSI